MKKLLLMAVAVMIAICASAQYTVKKVRIYKDNAVVYECNYADVDSIVFVDEIIPDVSDLPEGALSGEFSVSATKTVHFSRGNLQASTTDLGTTWTWDFAEHQWDYVGNAAANNAINGNGTVSANGIVDLFGWSTTATYYGINNSTTNTDNSGNFVDWGATIGEGWYTLSMDEWVYLFNTRTDAASKYGQATVADVHGIIVLPDVYNGIAINANHSAWGDNIISASDWAAYEAQGAVFLPAAGYRYLATIISSVGSRGYYWSSTPLDEYDEYCVAFDSFGKSDPESFSGRNIGRSVRLVR